MSESDIAEMQRILVVGRLLLAAIFVIGLAAGVYFLFGRAPRASASPRRPRTLNRPGASSEPRRFAQLMTDYPDDMVWDENENPVSPGCRNLCEAIIAATKPLGWQVDVFVQRNDFQWEFILKRGGEHYDFVTHDMGYPKRGCSVENHSRNVSSREAKREAEKQFLASLHQALMADSKVRSIVWSYDFDPDEDEAYDYPIDRA